MLKFFGAVITIALDIPAIMLRGFVLSQLWFWFLVPLGLPSIGKAQAMGIAVLVGLVAKNDARRDARRDGDDGDSSTVEKMFAALLTGVLVSLGCWGLGVLFHSYM